MGVVPSSVFLTNCVIIVEGITDVKYFEKFLELYITEKSLKRFEKGLHYLFFPVGGTNYVHIFNINENIIDNNKLFKNKLLILDGDNNNSNCKNLKYHLKDDFYKLNCKTVEHLIKLEILKKEFTEDKASKINNYDDLKDDLKINDKNKFCNEIIKQLKFDDLQVEAKEIAEKIYDFIESHNKIL